MSQDIDIDDHEDLQNVSESHQAEGSKCSVEKNVFSEQPLPIGGSDAYVSEPINSGEENNLTDESLEATTKEEVLYLKFQNRFFCSMASQNTVGHGTLFGIFYIFFI